MYAFKKISALMQQAISRVVSGEYDELYVFSSSKYGTPATDEFVLVQNHPVSQISAIIQKPHEDHSEIKYYDSDEAESILKDCNSFIPLSEIAMVLKKDDKYKKVKAENITEH